MILRNTQELIMNEIVTEADQCRAQPSPEPEILKPLAVATMAKL